MTRETFHPARARIHRCMLAAAVFCSGLLVTSRAAANDDSVEVVGAALQQELEAVRAANDDLQYDKVIKLTKGMLNRDDIPLDVRVEVFTFRAIALAAAGDAVQAEVPFRMLLRAKPDFDLPAKTSPRVLSVFRKVQVEERAMFDQLAELRRRRLIEDLELSGGPPEAPVGGEPLPFTFRLFDQSGAVETATLQYRRGDATNYDALALGRDEAGRWIGELPGQLTENDDGLKLEYYVETLDRDRTPLLVAGGATKPFSLEIQPGTVFGATPFYETAWFWVLTSVVVVGAGVGTAVAVERVTAHSSSDLGLAVVK